MMSPPSRMRSGRSFIMPRRNSAANERPSTAPRWMSLAKATENSRSMGFSVFTSTTRTTGWRARQLPTASNRASPSSAALP